MNFQLMNIFLPKIAYAASERFESFLTNVNKLIINPLITLLFALAVVYFLWGVLGFFLNQDNEEQRTESKKHMLWGVIGITIMMGVWTILSIILNTLNIPTSEINPERNEVDLNDYNPTFPIR
jgi:succinate dehydrogenase/fumarate reductase cytochrome b subunit